METIFHILYDVGVRRFSGAKIREAREALDLSREQLAEMIKVTPRTLYNWEHELFFPGADDLSKLAGALKMPIEWFFVERDDASR